MKKHKEASIKKTLFALSLVIMLSFSAIYYRVLVTNNAVNQLKVMREEQIRSFHPNSIAIKYYSENCPKQFDFLTEAAQKGQAIAQDILGGCYYYGLGVARDEEQAIA